MTDSFDLAIREKFALVEFEREQMHPYQDEAKQFAIDHEFCMLMIDMGLGKTISSLTVVADLLMAFLANKVLVIGPLKVVTDTWPSEIPKWRHTAFMNYTLLRETDDDPRLAQARARAREFGRSEGLGPREIQALQNRAETQERERIRRQLAKSPTSIHIINRENVEWLVNLHGPKWPYRFVIIDECFVAGTMVSTPAGGRAIETLLPGDQVSTPYGALPLSRVIRKRATSITTVHLENGDSIRCTPDHPWLTDAGWITAAELEGRTVYDEQDIASVQLRPLRERVLDVEVSPTLLRAFLLAQGDLGERRNGSCAAERSEAQPLQEGLHPMEQGSPLAGRDSQEDGQGEISRAVHVIARRQRRRHGEARGDVVGTARERLDSQLRGPRGHGEGQWLPNALQDRLCMAEQDDCAGGGRVEPLQPCSSAVGSSEGSISRGMRVVRVSHQECGGGVDVFDLTVEGAPYYFAQGRLVHNCSSFKDHNSHRFKALAKVRNTPGLIERLICLTATPAAETYEHLFAQFYLLDRGDRLGKDIGWYRERYFTYNQWSRKYKLRPGAEEEILAKIADITLVMKAKDHLPRDEPTVIRRMVKLSPEQRAMIKDFEKEFVLTLTDGTEIEAKTAAMLSSMLLQLASGAVYETKYVGDYETEDLKKVKKVHHVHDHKIDTLREIYEEAQTQGENIIVAYYWQSSLARLKKAFPKAVVMDREAKHAKPWNAGKIPMLLIHPQSAGHGLNLQKGGHILVFFDLIYSLEYYLQTIGRIDRQGQMHPVVIQLLVAEGTRDELVADANLEKQDAQEKLFTILKRLIRKLRGKPDLIE